MTVGVNPAISTSNAPAAGWASRQAETSPGGFDDALDRTASRGEHAEPGGEGKSKVSRWRQHDAQADAGRATEDASTVEPGDPESEINSADTKAGDDLLDTVGAPPEDDEADEGTEDDDDEPSLPAQIKAENAISAMMAMAPVTSRDPSDKSSGQQQAGDEAADQASTVQSAKASPLDADQAAATSTDGKADTGAQAASVSSAVTDTSKAVASQTAGAAGSGAKAGSDAGKAAKPADLVGSQPAASDQSVTSEQQKSSSSGTDGEGGQSNAGAQDRRDAAPEARRSDPQSTAAKVSVVSQQAVPAPAAAPALNANATAIVSAIDANQSWRPAAGPPAQAARTAQPMRSLKIQLHPAELGMVTANLKAAGDQLSVELQVDSHEAYHRLSADSDAIVKSLRSLGYDIDHVSIQQPQAATANAARADANAGTGSFSRDASSFQPGNSGSGGERAGGQTRGRGDGGDAQRNDQAQPVYQDRTGGGVYI